MSGIPLAGRIALLVALLASTAASTAASAQTPRAPGWRLAVGAGLTANSDSRFGRPGDDRSATLSLGAERRVWGPLSVGARGAAHASLAPETDGFRRAYLLRTAEAFAAGTVRVAPRVDLRATVGLGMAAISYPTADPFFSTEATPRLRRTTLSESFAAAGIGADVYLAPGVGVGGEVRLVSSLGEPTASEASLGLRIRLP